MPLLRTVLTGGLRAAIGISEALGARGPRWEWKKRAWEQALEARLAHWENVGRGVAAPLRMCPSCRQLVERSLSTCPACGGSMRGVAGGGVGRALGLVVPGAPSVSSILLTANVVFLMVTVAIATRFGANVLGALWSPPGEILWLLGSKSTESILAGEVWRLLTANFLHGGVLHLGLNSLGLVSLGPLIERSWGARKFFLIYITTGVAGFALSAWFMPGANSIGASAALYGLLAFAFVFARFRSSARGRAIASQLGQSLLYMVAMFFVPGIDNVAHVGGAVAGALLALVVDPTEPRTPLGRAWLWTLTVLALAATVGGFILVAAHYPEHLEELRRQGLLGG